MRTFAPIRASIAILSCSFLLCSVWTGCTDELPTGTTNGVIMPLKVGNRWIGRETTFNEDGTVSESHLDTLTIISRISPEGQTGSIWYEGSNDIAYSNRDGGLYTINDCRCMEAKYPAQPSDTFNTLPPTKVIIPGDPDPVAVDQTTASKVFGTEESIMVPAGTFSCYHYAPVLIEPLGFWLLREKHSYYAPNIGPVRIDEYKGSKAEGEQLFKRWELVEVYLVD